MTLNEALVTNQGDYVASIVEPRRGRLRVTQAWTSEDRQRVQFRIHALGGWVDYRAVARIPKGVEWDEHRSVFTDTVSGRAWSPRDEAAA